MRRLLALCLIVTFILVSSLPLLPDTVSCAHADERMAADSMMTHAQPATMQHGHESADGLSEAAQHCRIECGCGCHRDLDQLPHQFAPHIAVLSCQPVAESCISESVWIPLKLDALPRVVPVPPPKIIS